MLRFRPIMMTTMAALLGGAAARRSGPASVELRRPLGIAIVGGLIVGQMLTLYTTPVVYVYMDRLPLPEPSAASGRGARAPMRSPSGMRDHISAVSPSRHLPATAAIQQVGSVIARSGPDYWGRPCWACRRRSQEPRPRRSRRSRNSRRTGGGCSATRSWNRELEEAATLANTDVENAMARVARSAGGARVTGASSSPC